MEYIDCTVVGLQNRKIPSNSFSDHSLQALARAIRAVTDMNDDLAVEKIEIHTKSEETMA